MNDFAILAPFFAIVCPVALFGFILLLGGVAEGAALFLVALAVVLVHMHYGTNVEVM